MPLRKGETGKTIEVYFVDDDDVAIDISDADTIQIIFRKPDGSEVTEDAEFIVAGVDGGIEFAVIDPDWLDQDTNWSKQGIATKDDPDGYIWKTEIGYFQVGDNL